MKRFHITVNGNAYDVQVEEVAAGAVSAPVSVPAAPAVSAPAAPAAEAKPAVTAAAPEGSEPIKAPMPGTIVNVQVKVGDSVTKGQVLLILEAMKMENEIMSPRDAVVTGIHVTKGDSVNSGDLMVSLK